MSHGVCHALTTRTKHCLTRARPIGKSGGAMVHSPARPDLDNMHKRAGPPRAVAAKRYVTETGRYATDKFGTYCTW
ncbi:hypothetical protein MMAGJ_43140 [Mycolicibacterium mageritense]|uniref:Uncharacterized protein n=1 Tax=Mycolicibacterium mageritense TaxID=53462 RepID=A0ABM7HWP5_MYCME|nr:hypothetical protein MMAGJ_43140 [Mycolicibacterium mageritense]GJJ18955.1 hypothetical protein MTY414_26280 [Mycolicibacterium mageritense]